jgi:hypothetical protein
MVDVKNPKCISDWCSTIVNQQKYNGYCLYCFVHLFPDKPVSRNYKTKESAVDQYVREHFVDVDIVSDKAVQGGCSLRRPDILIDLGFQVLIVEIDENQHTNYDCSCENKRVMQLSIDVGHRPIVFIRFNPDEYVRDSIKVSSCWCINKIGICCIKKSKQAEWNRRLEVLKDHVEYWVKHKTDKLVETIQLFYDS